MEPLLDTYLELKRLVSLSLGVEHNPLHYAIGLALLVVALLYLRRAPGHGPFAFAFVLALGLGIFMEIADRRDMLQRGLDWSARLSLLDVLRTIAAPALGWVIYITVRRLRTPAKITK